VRYAGCKLVLFGPSRISEDLNKRCWTFFLLYQYTAQQQRRRLLWNVLRRFGRWWSFNSWPRDFSHPSPNFHRGVKKFEIWHHIWHRSIWPPAFKNAARYLNNETNLIDDPPNVLEKFSEVRSTHPWECPEKIPHTLKLHSESVLNHQWNSAVRWPIVVKLGKMMRHWDCGGCGAVTIHFRLKPKLPTAPHSVRNSKSSLLRHHLPLRHLHFETERYLNSETNSASVESRRMTSPSLIKFGPRTPENRPQKVPLP